MESPEAERMAKMRELRESFFSITSLQQNDFGTLAFLLLAFTQHVKSTSLKMFNVGYGQSHVRQVPSTGDKPYNRRSLQVGFFQVLTVSSAWGKKHTHTCGDWTPSDLWMFMLVEKKGLVISTHLAT